MDLSLRRNSSVQSVEVKDLPLAREAAVSEEPREFQVVSRSYALVNPPHRVRA